MAIVSNTISILPGQSFTLPKGSTVESVSGVLINSCDFDLPDPIEFLDYQFRFAINQDDNDLHPLGGEIDILGIEIDGVYTSLTFNTLDTDNTGNSGIAIFWNIEISAANQILSGKPVKFVSIQFDDLNIPKSDQLVVTIKIKEDLKDKVFLHIGNPNNSKFPSGLYIKRIN